jgi:Ca2+-binding RTX toxin-like protein
VPSFTVEGGNVISTLTYNTTATYNLALAIANTINSNANQTISTTVSTPGFTGVAPTLVGVVVTAPAPSAVVGTASVSVLGAPGGLTFNAANNSTDFVAIAGGNNSIGLGLGTIYTVATGAGNDTILANGSGVVDAGSGTNSVIGSGANDTIFAAGSNDFIAVGPGSQLVGESGSGATIFGGLGADTIALSGSTSDTVSASTGGTETLFGGLNNTVFTNGSALTFVSSTVVGGGESDLITGSSGAVVQYFGTVGATSAALVAGTGNETLNGAGSSVGISFVANVASGGVYSIAGGAGNDTLFGGAGTSTVSGGGGANTFAFDASAKSAGKELITDFKSTDMVVLLNGPSNQVATALASAKVAVVGGVTSTTVTLADTTQITFVGSALGATQVTGFNKTTPTG